MCKKLTYLVSAVVLLSFPQAVLAGTVLQFSFDGTIGADVPSGLLDDTGTYTATIIEGSEAGSTIKYAAANPAYNTAGTSAQFSNTSWSNNAGDTFLVPNDGGINFGSFDEFTAELFIYPDSSGSGNIRRVFSEYIYAYMYLDTENTLHAIRKWSVEGKWNENWTHLQVANFPHDTWSHIAMTWDTDAAVDKFKLYVDGELVAGDPGTSTATVDSPAGFTVGGYQREEGSTAQFFQGMIDEFRLSDAALDPGGFLGAVPSISFQMEASGDLESVSPAELVVVLNAAEEGQAYTVDYAATGGTAEGGVDYTLEPGTLTFDPGETAQTISIDVINDGLDEEDETIIVELLDPAGPNVVLTDPNLHTYTIRDPRPAVGFDKDSTSAIPEDAGPIEITVSLSFASDKIIMVDYEVTGGTATGSGVDYMLDPGTLTFDAGQTSKTITIALVEDDEVEDEETVVVTLFNAGNAKLGQIAEHTAAIRDPWASGAFEVFKVDLACPGNAATAKEGWVAFEGGAWCDGDRHDGRAISNIDDTGIDAYIDNVPGGGSVNLKTSSGDPICNTAFMDITGDVFGPPSCSIIIRLSGSGLVAGEYWLYAFHNWPQWSTIPSVTASGTGVTQIAPVTNVPIQNVQSDDELIPSLIKFYTDGSGPVTITYEAAGGQKAVVNAFALFSATPPDNATAPSPGKGATNVSPETALSWKAGAGATSHDVYLGTDETAVENATTASDEYQDNVLDTSYDPAGLLDFGQTYYWRIDEVTDTETVLGKVWSFTTADGKATDPDPANGSGNRPLDLTLSWTAGVLATAHDVYFGTNPDALTLVSPGQALTNYDTDTLQKATTYYWRIDQISATTIVEGDLWSFTTVGLLHLKVDLAHPISGDSIEPRPGTAKEGWWPWVAPRWFDMYSHDIVWERGESGEGGTPPDTDGIDGSGVHATLNCGYEGQAGLHAKDLCRCNLAGDCAPSGSIVGDPIANTWLYAVDWAGPVAGDIQLRFSALPPGEYELISYHNHWEPCSQGSRNCMRCTCGMPPMPSVTANPLPPTAREGTRNWPFQPGTGAGVTAIQNAFDVHVTNVNSDDQVATSTIIFETDGTNDVLIIYEAPDWGYPDCARGGREGGRGILNAFELKLISAGGCACLGDVSDTGGFGEPDGKVDIGDLNALLFAMLGAYPDGDPTGLYEIDAAGLPCGADVSDTGGFGGPDGKVDIGDLNALLFAMLGAYPDGDPTGIYEVPCL